MNDEHSVEIKAVQAHAELQDLIGISCPRGIDRERLDLLVLKLLGAFEHSSTMKGNKLTCIVNFLSRKVSDEHSDHENVAIGCALLIMRYAARPWGLTRRTNEAPRLFFTWKALDPAVSRSEGGGEKKRKRNEEKETKRRDTRNRDKRRAKIKPKNRCRWIACMNLSTAMCRRMPWRDSQTLRISSAQNSLIWTIHDT
jgi:hypothetical protein